MSLPGAVGWPSPSAGWSLTASGYELGAGWSSAAHPDLESVCGSAIGVGRTTHTDQPTPISGIT